MASGLQIKTTIENSTLDEKIDMIEDLYDKWIIKENKNLNIFDCLECAIENFNLSENFQLGSFEKAVTLAMTEVSYLKLYTIDINDELDDDIVKKNLSNKLNAITCSIVSADNAIRYNFKLKNSIIEDDIKTGSIEDLFDFIPMDTTNTSAFQNLLLYLLENLARKGYRRYNGDCYEKIYTPDGHDTHCWKKSKTLTEFIYESARKDINPEMWKNLTNAKGNVAGAVEYLENHVGVEFEDVKKDRHVFSFNDGIYITVMQVDGRYVDEWVPYGSKKLGTNIVSSNYFNLSFDSSTRPIYKENQEPLLYSDYDIIDTDDESDEEDTNEDTKEDSKEDAKETRKTKAQEAKEKQERHDKKKERRRKELLDIEKYETSEEKLERLQQETEFKIEQEIRASEYRYNNWWHIIVDKCPLFKSIMDYQEWPEKVQRFLCVMIGRCFYNVGELDGWQVIVFLLGQAGSGKSTILDKILKKVYEACDVAVMSNNIEKKFGLQAIYDRLLFIASEIKENFGLEQAEFQSMVSGEGIMINKKNKVGESLEHWTVPGMMAGNVVPQWNDNSGSISRRMLTFLFNKRVKKGDTQLGNKLEKEIGYIIHGCNRAYLDALNKYGTEDVWNIVPKYFRKARDEMAETTNALTNFLNSDKVVLGPNETVKETVFIDAFNDHCRELNYPKQRWNSQYCMGPFSVFNIETKKHKRGHGITSTVFKGVSVKQIIRQEDESVKFRDE